jgi:hypothetical protein
MSWGEESTCHSSRWSRGSHGMRSWFLWPSELTSWAAGNIFVVTKSIFMYRRTVIHDTFPPSVPALPVPSSLGTGKGTCSRMGWVAHGRPVAREPKPPLPPPPHNTLLGLYTYLTSVSYDREPLLALSSGLTSQNRPAIPSTRRICCVFPMATVQRLLPWIASSMAASLRNSSLIPLFFPHPL